MAETDLVHPPTPHPQVAASLETLQVELEQLKDFVVHIDTIKKSAQDAIASAATVTGNNKYLLAEAQKILEAAATQLKSCSVTLAAKVKSTEEVTEGFVTWFKKSVQQAGFSTRLNEIETSIDAIKTSLDGLDKKTDAFVTWSKTSLKGMELPLRLDRVEGSLTTNTQKLMAGIDALERKTDAGNASSNSSLAEIDSHIASMTLKVGNSVGNLQTKSDADHQSQANFQQWAGSEVTNLKLTLAQQSNEMNLLKSICGTLIFLSLATLVILATLVTR